MSCKNHAEKCRSWGRIWISKGKNCWLGDSMHKAISYCAGLAKHIARHHAVLNGEKAKY